MTKTKSQKMRAKLMKGALTQGMTNSRTKAQREFQFLNGNTISFLNGVARKTNRNRRNNIGQQARSKRVSAPVASGFAGLSSKARITTMNSGVTRVRHSEFVKDIAPSSGFSAETFPINPGTSDLFPWLSTIAQRFESYQFKDLNIRFETTSPTNTAGTAIITVDYNPQGIVPASKTQALAMESAVRTPVWGSVNHRSLGHNLAKRKTYYVRSPRVAPTDVDLYDTGLAVMMVEGVPSDVSVNVGEMYVDYEVDLITPVLDSDITGADSVKVISGSAVGSMDARYLFERPGTESPEGQQLITYGPGLNVDVDHGTIGGKVGAIQFLRSGQFMVTFDFVTNGTGVTFDNAAFGWGKSASAGNAIEVANVTPGGYIVIVDDINAKTCMAVFAVSTRVFGSTGRPTLGIGFGASLGVDPDIVSTIRISDYNYSLA